MQGGTPAVDGRHEVFSFARQVGINLSSETDLIWLAEAACYSPLSFPWVAVSSTAIGQADHSVYYYDQTSGVTSWEHPLAQYVLPIVQAARAWKLGHGQFETHMAELYTTYDRRLREDLQYWHGPYQSASGPYYYNASKGVSSWEDPRDLAWRMFEFQQGLLHGLQARLRSTVNSPSSAMESNQHEQAVVASSPRFGCDLLASDLVSTDNCLAIADAESVDVTDVASSPKDRKMAVCTQDSNGKTGVVNSQRSDEAVHNQNCDDAFSLTYSSSRPSSHESSKESTLAKSSGKDPDVHARRKHTSSRPSSSSSSSLPALKRSSSCAAAPVQRGDRADMIFPKFPVPPRPAKEESIPIPSIPPPLRPQANLADASSPLLARCKTSSITLPAISTNCNGGEPDPLTKLGSKHKKLGLTRPDNVMKALRRIVTVTSKMQDEV